MPAVAATNPPVLIGLVASATSRIRVGSGGVMLPNHAPLVVAEQFALLEAAYPGRIDLGIGRAPGTDPVTSFALRHGAGGVTDEAVTRFPEYVDNVLAMMEPGGVGLDGGRPHPRAAGDPGRPDRARRSGCSAPRTTRPGWPPRRGCPTSSPTTSPAPAPPRRSSSTGPPSGPSPELAEPRTFLTVNAVVAESAEEAERRALPNLLMMVALRTGAPLGPQLLVEEAEKVDAAGRAPAADRRDAARAGWSATRDSARAQLEEPRGDVRRGRGDGPPGRRRPRGHRSRRAARPARRRCGCWRLTRARFRDSSRPRTRLSSRPNMGLSRGASRLPGTPATSLQRSGLARAGE